MRVRLAACVVATLVTCVSVASAEPMDPALERLVTDESCHRTAAGDWNDAAPPAASVPCKPDHVSFKKLMSQYAFAFAPNAMHSARTTGYGGFNIAIEADYTKISSDADYWKRGTQGPVDASNNSSSTENASPQGMLQLYSLKFRKGFGFGLELAGAVGFMPKTSIISGGADVRMSLLEGFRKGLGGVLPDIAIGGGVRTITGTPQFQMTIAGLDVQISKPLTIQDSSVLTPYIGYQYLWIFADSGLIDLTPGTDAIRYCNYTGQDVPGNTDPNAVPGSANEPNDGQPVCNGGSPLDFNNNAVFQNVRFQRHRLIFGLSYRYEMVMVGGQFLVDAVPPADAQTDAVNEAALQGEDRQYTMSFELGAMF